MGNSIPRRLNVDVRLQVRIEPEAEPPAEPASSQEEAAAAAEEAVDDGFAIVAPTTADRIAATPAPARPFYRNPERANFQVVALRTLPVLQRPTEIELNSPHLRIYIVWEVPGQNWAGIHWGRGLVPWRQIRSHAAAHLVDLTPDAAFFAIQWRRALGCNHRQLESSFRAEAEQEAECLYFLWR